MNAKIRNAVNRRRDLLERCYDVEYDAEGEPYEQPTYTEAEIEEECAEFREKLADRVSRGLDLIEAHE